MSVQCIRNVLLIFMELEGKTGTKLYHCVFTRHQKHTCTHKLSRKHDKYNFTIFHIITVLNLYTS